MTTSDLRMSITLEPALMNKITQLAAQENKSASKMVKELVIEALEITERSLFISNRR